MGFEMDPSYKDVPQRIADFRAKHPDGCLRPLNPDEPYRIEAIDGRFFIVYAAAAYRSPDDKLPGVGIAFEPFPGKTPYTKDSELQNAETSAWGRAIIAVLASESKHIASAEDVRNRQADADVQPLERFTAPDGTLVEVWPGELSAKAAKVRLLEACGGDRATAEAAWAPLDGKFKVTEAQLSSVIDKIGAGAEPQEGMPQDAGSTPAGSGPAASPGVQPGPKAAEAPAPNAQTSFGQNTLDARAIGIRAPRVFDKVIDRYPDRKKSWVQEHLRHALAYVVSDGKAATTSALDGAGLMGVWQRLNQLEDGTATLSFSADPANGCSFNWPDGSESTVMWTELTLAEAS